MSIKERYWPDVKNVSGAEQTVRHAAYAAFWLAGIGAVFSALAWFDIAKIIPPSAIFDDLLFALVGFFILRHKSRLATILALLLYIVEFIYSVQLGKTSAL